MNLVSILPTKKSMKRSKGNPMYEAHEEKGKKLTSPYGDKSDHRVKAFVENESIRESDTFVDCFALEGNNIRLNFFKEAWADVKKAITHGSFKQHLLEETKLREYCKAGISTKQETYILYFLRTKDREEERQINEACQAIISQLLLCLDIAVTVSEKNVNGSFWYNVYNLLGMDKFDSIIGMFPKGMRKRQFIASILFCLVNHFEMVIQRSIAKQDKTKTCNAYSGPQLYTEVQHFVGWAIYSRKVSVQKKGMQYT